MPFLKGIWRLTIYFGSYIWETSLESGDFITKTTFAFYNLSSPFPLRTIEKPHKIKIFRNPASKWVTQNCLFCNT